MPLLFLYETLLLNAGGNFTHTSTEFLELELT